MKLMATKLKPILQKLLTAFLAGKVMDDNIVIAQETVHMIKTRRDRQQWLLLKLDMEKAFDHLEWDFV